MHKASPVPSRIGKSSLALILSSAAGCAEIQKGRKATITPTVLAGSGITILSKIVTGTGIVKGSAKAVSGQSRETGREVLMAATTVLATATARRFPGHAPDAAAPRPTRAICEVITMAEAAAVSGKVAGQMPEVVALRRAAEKGSNGLALRHTEAALHRITGVHRRPIVAKTVTPSHSTALSIDRQYGIIQLVVRGLSHIVFTFSLQSCPTFNFATRE